MEKQRVNWDIVRDEIQTQLSEIEESALVYHYKPDEDRYNELLKELDEMYKKAAEDHWKFDTI